MTWERQKYGWLANARGWILWIVEDTDRYEWEVEEEDGFAIESGHTTTLDEAKAAAEAAVVRLGGEVGDG